VTSPPHQDIGQLTQSRLTNRWEFQGCRSLWFS